MKWHKKRDDIKKKGIIMKLISTLLLATMSLPVLSQTVNVYPRLINFGNQAQLQIHNTTRDNIHCSGFINIYTMFNQNRSEYFSEWIPAGMMRNRHIYLMNHGDRITHSHHSIRCTKTR